MDQKKDSNQPAATMPVAGQDPKPVPDKPADTSGSGLPGGLGADPPASLPTDSAPKSVGGAIPATPPPKPEAVKPTTKTTVQLPPLPDSGLPGEAAAPPPPPPPTGGTVGEAIVTNAPKSGGDKGEKKEGLKTPKKKGGRKKIVGIAVALFLVVGLAVGTIVTLPRLTSTDVSVAPTAPESRPYACTWVVTGCGSGCSDNKDLYNCGSKQPVYVDKKTVGNNPDADAKTANTEGVPDNVLEAINPGSTKKKSGGGGANTSGTGTSESQCAAPCYSGAFAFKTCASGGSYFGCATTYSGGCAELAQNLGCYQTGGGAIACGTEDDGSPFCSNSASCINNQCQGTTTYNSCDSCGTTEICQDLGGGKFSCSPSNIETDCEQWTHFKCPDQYGGNCTSNGTTSVSKPSFKSPYCGSQQIDCSIGGAFFVGSIDKSGCGGKTTTTTATTTSTTTRRTPTDVPLPICVLVKIYINDGNSWVETAAADLGDVVTVGDTIRLTVSGGGGSFSSGRFTINGETPLSSTTKMNGEFYIEYVIPTDGTFNVVAEVFGQ